MGTFLTPEFIERRISRLTTLPEGWNAAKNINLYELDLKMCQIKALSYTFDWGKESDPPPRVASLLDTPTRVLRLDISLNELTSLPHNGLSPFRNLRDLDASLNKLSNFQGIEVLHHLYRLNLSHNVIRTLHGLANNAALVELNLSMNDFRDISDLPSLINLKLLNISSNKLQSLDGLSSLPKLEELNVQRNELRDIVPITSCLHLRIFNAANNRIADLRSVTSVLEKMRWLHVLSLYGNPIEREYHYQNDILRSANVMTLDNIAVRPLPKAGLEPRHHSENILTLKDAARQAFEERARSARTAMEENVNFLQRRIIALQDEYRESESKMAAELDMCLRNLDTLSSTEAGQFNRRSFDFLPNWTKPWERSPLTGRRGRADYGGIRDTDEVLKCAYNELISQRESLDRI